MASHQQRWACIVISRHAARFDGCAVAHPHDPQHSFPCVWRQSLSIPDELAKAPLAYQPRARGQHRDRFLKMIVMDTMLYNTIARGAQVIRLI